MAQQPVLSFQEIINRLNNYWSRHGCLLWTPHHEMVGAGTYNPATILRVLGPEPWNVAYVEPSFRPDDGRFADSPNRMQMHHQYQVILKPIPENCQQLYLESLFELGIKRQEHDLRFVEDNWESPALSAWGLGWEVWLDGMEVTQYTYFQQGGGIDLDPPACELTYGLERLAMYLQNVTSVWDLTWDGKLSYAEVLKKQEIEFCEYDFNFAEISRIQSMFDLYSEEAKHCIQSALVAPALDYVLRCSHAFNVLDARGAIGLSERVKFFGKMRDMTRQVAKLYAEQREKLSYPLLKSTTVPAVAVKDSKTEATQPQTFALEIGCEELAAFAAPELSAQLRELLPQLLNQARLGFESVYVTESPRRLIAVVKQLSARQEDRVRKVKGPAKAACEKNPQALIGFCRKQGVDPSTVTYAQEGENEFAFVEVHETGKSTGEILSSLIPELISKLKLDSSMRWLGSPQFGAEAKVSFNRPIRWIVALYGTEQIYTRYAGVNSSNVSYSGRWSGCQQLPIKSASEFLSTLEQQAIQYDSTKRRTEIRTQVQQLAASVKGNAKISDSQLDEVNQLVEHPQAFLCSMEQRFLTLPAEVLVSTVEKHVRCFCVFDANGNLLPYFIGVRNGTADHIDIVRGGFERLITARFNDARFFIERDQSQKLESFRENIKKLVFHAKVGSMFDKTERLAKLADGLAADSCASLKADRQALKRAALLSKADLGSEMVVEMTSLQGSMGQIYAIKSGENELVACAIAEHYLPKNAADKIPASAEGIILSLADRIDTLASLFSVGVEPTGSADQFGLRREALGLLQILIQAPLNFSLRAALTLALSAFPSPVDQTVVEKVCDFINKRFEVFLREQGLRHDCVSAVLARNNDNPFAAFSLIKELDSAVRDSDPQRSEQFTVTLQAYLRCKWIVDSAIEKKVEISPSYASNLLVEAEEKELAKAIQQTLGTKEAEQPSLSAALKKVQKLQPSITGFFDKVMVMSEDQKIRANRLALLNAVREILLPYADPGKLEGFRG